MVLLGIFFVFAVVVSGAPSGSSVVGVTKPYHYNLYLRPDIYGDKTEGTLEGKVSIYFEVVEPTQEFQFDTVTTPVLIRFCEVHNNQPTSCNKYSVRLNRNYLVSNTVLPKGKYVVEMEYSGVSIGNHGFAVYISKEKKGNAMVTQFQPSMAQLMFPCVDRPDMKATFNITVSRRKDYTAVSNSPLLYSKPGEDGYVDDVFATTVKMSTYIVSVSLVIGYEKYETQSKSGVKVGIWSDEGIGKGALSDAIVKLLDYFEDYTKIPYPMPKYDQIGFRKYNFGAMENWGLVTWGEMYMRSPGFLAPHETAHQWMGNLVTCEDWSFVWFQEAAARLFEDIALRDVMGWSALEVATGNTIPRSFLPALEEDASGISKPLIVAKAGGMDALRPHIYNKGSVIYQMIHHVLGDNNFREMWRRIMKKYQYSTINYAQFSEALQEIVYELGDRYGDKDGFDVPTFLHSWLKQPGIPVVTVTRNGADITVSQRRLDLSGNPEGLQAHLWSIPLTINSPETIRGKAKDKVNWINQEKVEGISVDGVSAESAFVVGDVASNGFFLVNYDDENWDAIGKALAEDVNALPPVSRMRHWIAVSYLLRHGDVGPIPVLSMARSLNSDDQHYSEEYGLKALHHILSAFMDSEPLKDYMRANFKKSEILCRVAASPCEDVKAQIDAAHKRTMHIMVVAALPLLRNEEELLHMYRKLCQNVDQWSFDDGLAMAAMVTYSPAAVLELEGLLLTRKTLRPKKQKHIDEAIAKISANIEWKKQNQEKLEKWLTSQ